MLTKAKVNWVSEHGFNPHHPMDAKELEQKAAQEKKKQAAERAARDAETKEKARAAPKRDGGGGRGGAGGAADAGVDKAKADAKEKGAALSAGAREFTPTKAPGAAPRSARDRDRNVRAAAAASDGGRRRREAPPRRRLRRRGPFARREPL